MKPEADPSTPPPESSTPPAPDSTPPPAAAVVQGGSLPEDAAAELIRLRQERENDGRTLKARELRIAELEDENTRLKTPPPRAPQPTRADWLSGATFLG